MSKWTDISEVRTASIIIALKLWYYEYWVLTFNVCRANEIKLKEKYLPNSVTYNENYTCYWCKALHRKWQVFPSRRVDHFEVSNMSSYIMKFFVFLLDTTRNQNTYCDIKSAVEICTFTLIWKHILKANSEINFLQGNGMISFR